MLERFASWATRWTGSTTAFILAAAFVVVWLVTGPLFHWSDTWQLVANTITTIITFMMVFLIQRTQNKDSLAIHLKLNEIVAATTGASNRLVDEALIGVVASGVCAWLPAPAAWDGLRRNDRRRQRDARHGA